MNIYEIVVHRCRPTLLTYFRFLLSYWLSTFIFRTTSSDQPAIAGRKMAVVTVFPPPFYLSPASVLLLVTFYVLFGNIHVRIKFLGRSWSRLTPSTTKNRKEEGTKATRKRNRARSRTLSAFVLWWVRVMQYAWLIIHQKLHGYVYFAHIHCPDG